MLPAEGLRPSASALHTGAVADLETADLVDGWWEYHRLASGTRLQRKALEAGLPEAAVAGRDAVMEAMDAGGPAALSLVPALLEAAPGDDDVALVGAGPLEELLHAHGLSLRPDVEAVARQHERFRRALDAVWLDGQWATP